MPKKDDWLNESNKCRFTVEMPPGYIQALDRFIQNRGIASRSEYMRENIEALIDLESELYNSESTWDRLKDINLKILETQVRRHDARFKIAREFVKRKGVKPVVEPTHKEDE